MAKNIWNHPIFSRISGLLGLFVVALSTYAMLSHLMADMKPPVSIQTAIGFFIIGCAIFILAARKRAAIHVIEGRIEIDENRLDKIEAALNDLALIVHELKLSIASFHDDKDHHDARAA